MLRAFAFAELFSENLDAYADGILLTTIGGHLVGVSPSLPQAVSKRLSVLGSLTWRFIAADPAPATLESHPLPNTNHASSNGNASNGTDVDRSHQANAAAAAAAAHDSAAGAAVVGRGAGTGTGTRAQPLKVVQQMRTQEGHLRTLVMEFEGRICLLEYVRASLLVGVVSAEKAAITNGTAGGFDDGGDGEADGSQDESGSEGDRDRKMESEREGAFERARLIRLLGLKAGALADYLRDELRDFRIPHGIE